MKKTLLLLQFLLLISCGDDKLKKVETLNSFRVLAIESASPELTQSAGLSVTVRPYVSDINGNGRIINAVIDGCIDPGISLGAEVTCDENASKVSVNYSINTSTLPKLNSGWGSYSAGLAIPDMIFTNKSNRDKYNGVPYIVIFNFTVDGVIFKSFKRILITSRTSLNSNPALNGLLLNSSTLAKPNLNDYLSATVSGVENYDFVLVDGTVENRNETLTMAWYVSSGELDISKANASESVKYKSNQSSSPLLIVGVLRDERGGVSVLDNLLQ
jgi:hypothetical protein